MKSHAAETAGPPPAPGPRHTFTARLPDGVVGITVPADAASPFPVLDAARALAAAEPAWQAVEDWFGAGLVPTWVPPTVLPGFAEHAVLSHPSLPCDLHLPMSTLRRVGSPPPAEFGGGSWQPMPCDLVFDAIGLSAEDLAGLHPGALVLLPAAFASAWHGRLVPTGGAAGVYGVHLHEQRGRLQAVALGQAVPHPANDHVTLRFAHPIPVRPSHLLGWAGARPPALDAPLLQSPDAVVLHAPALQQSRPLAVGQLMPVGSGYAVRIDRLAESVAVAPSPLSLEPAESP